MNAISRAALISRLCAISRASALIFILTSRFTTAESLMSGTPKENSYRMEDNSEKPSNGSYEISLADCTAI
jgi:hypothetical protein